MTETFRNKALSPEERAADLLSRLTLREKVGQLNQRLYGFHSYSRVGNVVTLSDSFKAEVKRWGGLGVLYGLFRADPWANKDFSTGLTGGVAIRAYNLAQQYVISHSRFGIPMLLSTEASHGHQALDGYLLPVNLAMGAAWNPALVEKAFTIVGRQLQEIGVDLALVSMLDVLRDPRWGRSEECYSEDPYLCARNAQAAVKGCMAGGVAVVAKHFCAQGETTGGVNASAARIGERELREIHMPPMAAAAKAGVQGVMAAYNEIDGIPCHANSWLLQDVLRGEMGFNGIVMADGCAIDRLGLLTGGDAAAGGAAALSAGVDVSLWDEGFPRLEEAVARGLVDEAALDRAVFRVLTMKFARGLFEQPYLEEKPLTTFSPVQYPQSLDLARQSIVLLKNDGILPLSSPRRIAVIGPNADSIYQQLGDYTPPLRDEGITVLAGLTQLLPHSEIRFSPGCTICGGTPDAIADAKHLAEHSDLVLLVLGGSSSRFASETVFDTNGAAMHESELQMDCGEGVDTADLALPGMQLALAEAIFAVGKPVVTVLISGRPYAVPEISQKSAALLWAFYPGPWGGQAIAEILTGSTEPSGCLPVSLPRTTGQLPVYYNARASYAAMRYRDLAASPLYPFGFGLHYVTPQVEVTEYTETISIAALHEGKTVCINCYVRNTSEHPAWATLQLYIKGMSGSVIRRVKELKAFEKVHLSAGETCKIRLVLDQEAFGIWNRQMQFSIEPGSVQFLLEESGRPIWHTEFHITQS